MSDVNDRGGAFYQDFEGDPCELGTALLKAMKLENQYVTEIVLTVPHGGLVRARVEMYVQVEDDPRLAAALVEWRASQSEQGEEKAR